MFDEKNRVALALNSMQTQLRHLQLPGSALPSPNALSWDLSSAEISQPTIDVTPSEFSASPQTLSAHETSLNQF
ncbi:MAG: hypothetical protein HC866_05625 [Leptolyngbyaceae cyanobacterium RU_5_1]|nr:hypothetical protein [Leptolyngbyaceae cyanobacterium RU_5_1]